MSSSPEQTNSFPLTTSHISRARSDTSMTAPSPHFSVRESSAEPSHSLSPPQLVNIMNPAPSSTPSSPHLGRPANKHKGGMRMKFLRKPHPSTSVSSSQTITPNVSEDPLVDSPDNQAANRALFVRMLKRSWQLQPRKFRRLKRRTDKQYHSDDGYTSDPGVLREDDDDETDNDPDVNEIRRLSHIRDVERKLEKVKRSIPDCEETLVPDAEDYDTTADKPSQNKLGLRLHRNMAKSKSFQEYQRRKMEKLETQLKDLHDGGGQDLESSRRTRFKGRLEGGLKGMALPHRVIIKGLTHAGSKLRRKRIEEAPHDEEEVIIDDEDDEPYQDDDMGRISEDVILATDSQSFVADQDEIISILKADLDALRLSTEVCNDDCKSLREQLIQQDNTLTLIVEKFEQEIDRMERLEGQLNDVMELHQHEVCDLRAQLSQIENSAIMRGQELEEAVEGFNSKFDKLDAHVLKLMDTSDSPDKHHHVARGPMVSLLSFLLILLAFIFKVVSIVRANTWLLLVVAVIVVLPFLWCVFCSKP